MWERSFVAMTVLAGGSLDDAAFALGEEGVARAGEIVVRLQHPQRASRAAALAEAGKDIAVAIDEVALR